MSNNLISLLELNHIYNYQKQLVERNDNKEANKVATLSEHQTRLKKLFLQI